MKLRALSLSFAFWAAFAVFGLKTSHLCLGGSRSDAPAHVDSTILFFHRGWEVYRQPIGRLGERSRSELARRYTALYDWPADGITDLLDIPERAGKPPLLVNWSYLPRPYPPGVFLYFLPEALLKESLGLSPKAAATLSLLKLLLAAHALLWLFASVLLEKGQDEDARELAAWIILPLLYLETISWTLHGFYDAAALIPLLLCVRSLRARRGLPGIFWYCASLFLHFRSLWFLPVLAWGVWLFVRNEEYRRLRSKERALAAASLAMLALSFRAFLLVYPWLMTLTPTNFFFMTAGPSSWVRLFYLLLPLALVGAALWADNAWLIMGCLFWTVIMVLRSPFVQMWHSYYLTPLFALTGLGERSAARTRLLVLLAYLVMGSLVFTHFCFNGLLASGFVKELWG
ncbi:MAG: hypothetical protein HY077_04310 [Elusimicrobia bacterium]|nr:hypothetical protein [Elusimicrobiota bacterium]